MRIIDQNGRDYPYESIAISYGDGIVYARPISNMDKRYLIAQYSTQDKAEKAMQMLHNCYQGALPNTIFRFPQDDEISAD